MVTKVVYNCALYFALLFRVPTEHIPPNPTTVTPQEKFFLTNAP